MREPGILGEYHIGNQLIRTEYVKVSTITDKQLIWLEGLLYYKPGLQYYHGIVTTHGRNGPHPSRDTNEIFTYRNLNIALAMKNSMVLFLVRRGYGNSAGNSYSEFLDTPEASGLAAAKDIAAGVRFLQDRGQVDPNNIYIIGHSQGGWASLAASSSDIPGVTKCINISGGTNYRNMGLGFITNSVQQDWVSGSYQLGALNKTPCIWIYAENDKNHPPEYVRQMFDAFIKAGGKGALHILPSYSENGHYISSVPELFVDLIYSE